MDIMTQVQTMDESGYFSHSVNTFGNGMNTIIFLPAMDE